MKEVEKIETALGNAQLKEWVKDEEGSMIKLVDIEHTRESLKDIADKYKHLTVTRENYKGEGAEAETALKRIRYMLQNIHKKNNKYLNDVKRDEKEVFDGLIQIIEGTEKRLKSEITAIEEQVKKEKEEAEQAEANRVKKLEENLVGWEENFNKVLTAIKKDEQLAEYDVMLEEFETLIPSFSEFEFKAKRLLAVFKGRRSEAVEAIAEIKKQEEDKKAVEEEKAKIEAKKDKVFDFRLKQLLAKGFEQDKLNMPTVVHPELKDLWLTRENILEFDEVDWTEYLETLDSQIAEKKASDEKELKASAEKAVKDWNELVDIYTGFGGDANSWKLEKDQIPTEDDIERLKEATKQLQEQKRMLKLQGVREEMNPMKDEFIALVRGFEKRLAETKFNHFETRDIFKNLITKVEGAINETLGEVINEK